MHTSSTSSFVATRRPKRAYPSSTSATASPPCSPALPMSPRASASTPRSVPRRLLSASLLLIFFLLPSLASAEEYSVVAQTYFEEFTIDPAPTLAALDRNVAQAVADLKNSYNRLIPKDDVYERKFIRVELICYVVAQGECVPRDAFTQLTRRLEELADVQVRDQDEEELPPNHPRALMRRYLSRSSSIQVKLVAAATCRDCPLPNGPLTKDIRYRKRALRGAETEHDRRLAAAEKDIPTTDELLTVHDKRIRNKPNKFQSVTGAIDLVEAAMLLTAEAEEAAANADVKAVHARQKVKYARQEEKKLEKLKKVKNQEKRVLEERLEAAENEHRSSSNLTDKQRQNLVNRILDLNRQIRDIVNELDAAEARVNRLKAAARKAKRKAKIAANRARDVLERAKAKLAEAKAAEAIAEAMAAKLAFRHAATEAKLLNRQLGDER